MAAMRPLSSLVGAGGLFPQAGKVAWMAGAGASRTMATKKDKKKTPRPRTVFPDHIPSTHDQMHQRSMYKKQMTDLRKKFSLELAADNVKIAEKQAKIKEEQAIFMEKCKAERLIRRQQAKERREALEAARLAKKDNIMAAAVIAREKRAVKITAKMEEKFANISLDANGWCSDMEHAEALVHDALVNAYTPHSRPPAPRQRYGQEDGWITDRSRPY